MSGSRVFIVDSMNYIFRAFHGLPENITAPSGMVTNAVLGYSRTLLRIIKEQKPEFLVAAFEGESSFRTEIFAPYKATRTQTPENLSPQFDYCKKMTTAIGIPVFESATFEADDVIGTIAVRMQSLGYKAVVITGDKDMSQLVCDDICVYDMAKAMWLDAIGVREKFGVHPCQIPDFLALLGDTVDNIPGVPGVGEKTARQILAICAGIEDLAEASDRHAAINIRNRELVLQRIRNTLDTVRLSRKLATICCDVPLDITPNTVRYRRGDFQLLSSLCRELGFRNLINEIPLAQNSLF